MHLECDMTTIEVKGGHPVGSGSGLLSEGGKCFGDGVSTLLRQLRLRRSTHTGSLVGLDYGRLLVNTPPNSADHGDARGAPHLLAWFEETGQVKLLVGHRSSACLCREQEHVADAPWAGDLGIFRTCTQTHR